MKKLLFITLNTLLCTATLASEDFIEREGGKKIVSTKEIDESLPIKSQGVFESLNMRIGGSISSSLFLERETGHLWHGKAQTWELPTKIGEAMHVNQAAAKDHSCRERIALDIYAYYGVHVPETVLSLQPITNKMVEFEGQEVMHILSRMVEGYHDYKDQVGFTAFEKTLHPRYGSIVYHSSSCKGCDKGEGLFTGYRAEGLGRIAAVATWIHDINFIGGREANTGYRIVQRGRETVAELVLVDAGFAFEDLSGLPYPPARHIQLKSSRHGSYVLAFETLCPPESLAYREFIETLHAIIATEERTLAQFFIRKNTEDLLSNTQTLISRLLERKEELATHYAEELATIPDSYSSNGSPAASTDISSPTTVVAGFVPPL